MDAVGGLLTGFGVILTPENLYLCFLGSLIGTLVGVLPGVGPLAALALLLPITFTLTPVGGMVMLASIFYGAMYGGSTTSILLNIPGEAASVVTSSTVTRWRSRDAPARRWASRRSAPSWRARSASS
jgi:putative tricarboxylic transport membrane protein